jgi:hypothetical protein
VQTGAGAAAGSCCRALQDDDHEHRAGEHGYGPEDPHEQRGGEVESPEPHGPEVAAPDDGVLHVGRRDVGVQGGYQEAGLDVVPDVEQQLNLLVRIESVAAMEAKGEPCGVDEAGE